MMNKNVGTKRKGQKQENRVKKYRLLFLIFCLFLCCIIIAGKLLYIDLYHGNKYKKKVLSQESYISNPVPFQRGDITDRNGNILATSQKVYNLILNPRGLLGKKGGLQKTMDLLQNVFGVSESEIRQALQEHPNLLYYRMKKYKALQAAKVKEFQEKEEKINKQARKNGEAEIQWVWFEDDYQRVYPYSAVASDVIGFCSQSNVGAWGLENEYNSSLNGTAGCSYGYFDSDLNLVKTVKAATNGYSIKSTIDVNVQGVLERHIARFLKNTGAKNIGCILMNPNNGEIYAMASNSSYDLNDSQNLHGIFPSEMIQGLTKKKKEAILNAIWRNYCISDTYEPGSTFKPFTVSACLDEGVTTNQHVYTCDGGQQIGNVYIKCVAHSSGGHGAITVQQALMYSCNDVLMQLGAALGKNRFLKYDNNYGFGHVTGIDLPGEATGSIFTKSTMHTTELATSSFGQGQFVTMVQLASAFSAVVNGGNYYQPHMVKEIDSSTGSVVRSFGQKLESKIITAHTSRLIRQDLYKTVEEGTAKLAQVPGYKIGGKTGTAEKHPTGTGNYVVSFEGCVPVSHPQLVSYVVIDQPHVADQAHSTYANEFTSSLLTDVLPLLNIYPETKQMVTDPNTGLTTKVTASKVKLPSTKKKNMYKGAYAESEYKYALEALKKTSPSPSPTTSPSLKQKNGMAEETAKETVSPAP